MMFVIGTLAYEFPVILPLFATVTFHGDAKIYSAMMAAIGLGAIGGALYTAGRASTRLKQVIWVAMLFGCSLLLVAAAPSFATALLLLVLVGVLSVLFTALGNTTLQLTSEPQMRGRVMSLWSIAFLGTTPIGGPVIGAIADHTNPRVGLAVGGSSALVASGLGVLAGRAKPAQAGNVSYPISSLTYVLFGWIMSVSQLRRVFI